MCLNVILTIALSLCICGCGILYDSYEEDYDNDWEIVREIIKANPVLDTVPAGYFFSSRDPESGHITGWLELGGLGLNDSNFFFTKSITNFRRVKCLALDGNDFTELPRGTRNKNWEAIGVISNRICTPSPETLSYLDSLMEGFPGGYWRDTQLCGDSGSTVTP